MILLFTLVLSYVISNNARRVMLKQSEEYSLLLAENLNQQVFRRFALPAASAAARKNIVIGLSPGDRAQFPLGTFDDEGAP